MRILRNYAAMPLFIKPVAKNAVYFPSFSSESINPWNKRSQVSEGVVQKIATRVTSMWNPPLKSWSTVSQSKEKPLKLQHHSMKNDVCIAELVLLQGEHVAALVEEMAYRAAPHHKAQWTFDGWKPCWSFGTCGSTFFLFVQTCEILWFLFCMYIMCV